MRCENAILIQACPPRTSAKKAATELFRDVAWDDNCEAAAEIVCETSVVSVTAAVTP